MKKHLCQGKAWTECVSLLKTALHQTPGILYQHNVSTQEEFANLFIFVWSCYLSYHNKESSSLEKTFVLDKHERVLCQPPIEHVQSSGCDIRFEGWCQIPFWDKRLWLVPEIVMDEATRLSLLGDVPCYCRTATTPRGWLLWQWGRAFLSCSGRYVKQELNNRTFPHFNRREYQSYG